LAAGGLAAALSLVGRDDLAGGKKKKKKKKPCKERGKICTPGGKRKCCKGLICDTNDFDETTQTRCCGFEGDGCAENVDCCGALCCSLEFGTCISACFSDRALKANFGTVDAADMLRRVQELPISTWNYTRDDPSVRHIGPMAQDFAATFGVGGDDRHIHPIDGQGVALVAIQGLAALVADLGAANARLAARMAALEVES
jgi:hypothetical protein